MKLLLLLIVSFTLLSLGLASQTVVIFKRTKNAIYVAADSRKVSTVLKEHTNAARHIKYELEDELSDTSCKIRFSNNIGVAMLGTFSELSFECALQACAKNKSILPAIKNYIDCYKPKLTDSLEAMRLKSASGFDLMIDPLENTLTEALFFGFAADTPYLYYIYFMRKDPRYTQLGRVELTVEAQVVFVNEACLGKKNEIEDSIRNPTTWRQGIITTIKKYAAISKKHNPKTVGGPIDIVMVTRTNRKWIQKKQRCK
jgi:hypothetical protein